ncbi:lasso peptide biosynthesis PqqD family chaperone [Domibacillus sp.]|uniref:lasso peptide biosynthesis PqqD family chaperone n=1 Tax=Domibacillus sp. TaxID=1969783 RepID=UPI0028109FBB|nr:lasso peptide biosynthesis PqqD family chaperone [Domibacillus sp.]
MNKSEILSTSHLVSQKSGNIVSDMDGEKVMLSIEKGRYYNLGEVGGDIWEAIKEPVSVSCLVESLTSQYAVQQADCQDQVIGFLNRLLEEGLIQVSGATHP